jgi:hypothetical protein
MTLRPRLPRWVPPLRPPSRLGPDLDPDPPLTALKNIFHWSYATLPAYAWFLSPRRLNEAVTRAVVTAARCYTPGCRGLDYMAADPDAHLGEYMTVCALASIDADELIAALYAADPTDEYPIAAFDPEARRPPFGGGHA